MDCNGSFLGVGSREVCRARQAGRQSGQIFFNFVGLSNILDKEINKEVTRREPKKRPHRSVVGASVVDGKLCGEVLKGKETM